ncbi:MAG: aspartate dehydrogenase [Lachnospiraceae bacterium]|nr:aspartate dehydrogenase [Lachnospiraceae bacterium]
MFGRKKPQKKTYDKVNQKPVLHCSICTGEQVAGFKDIHTGKFEDVMLIRNEGDLKKFMEMYDIETITKEY